VLAVFLQADTSSRVQGLEPLWAEIPWLVVRVVPFALLAVAPVVGVGAFAGERANGTLDALVMSPIPRRELVAARLLVEMRALGFLALVVLSAVLLLLPFLWRNALQEEFLILSCGFLPVAFLYLSVLLLHAALGLYCGLRYRSRACALLAGLAAALGIGLAEMVTFPLTVVCLDALVSGGTAPDEATGLVIGALLSGCGLGCLNLHMATTLLEQAAWLFDQWAISD
jgi:ABC-type transport system involved in multi-copper enzyme maturation permease subunit